MINSHLDVLPEREACYRFGEQWVRIYSKWCFREIKIAKNLDWKTQTEKLTRADRISSQYIGSL